MRNSNAAEVKIARIPDMFFEPGKQNIRVRRLRQHEPINPSVKSIGKANGVTARRALDMILHPKGFHYAPGWNRSQRPSTVVIRSA